ncbi:MAG: GMC family oxidoreductase [Candidatus Wallbacteria bacterium]|nr:GMC family oxidoreductase [Candidatus Wallbacteria bacterium]
MYTAVVATGDSTSVCIIGSGAAGGVLAWALARAGVDVVVLERGKPAKRDETAEDELLQVIRRSHQPPVERDGTVVVEPTARAEGEPTRVGQAYYLLGGGTILYAAASWRLRPDDLRKRSRYGTVPGSELVDWPLTYQDLEPWYTMAEKEIGVSGKSGADPTEPPRSFDHLMAPLDEDPFSARLAAAARKMGLRPFPIPTAISSRNDAYLGTNQCQYCGWCSGYTCLFYAKNSVDITVIPKALKTGRARVLTDSYATRIETDPRGRASAVIYRETATGAEKRLAVGAVCLAAGGVQSPRLLLMSASKQFPDGLANRSGLVGRYLMFHIEGRRTAVFDQAFDFVLTKKVGVHDWYFPAKTDAWINHCSIQSGSRRGPLRFALSREGWGEDYEAALARDFPRTQQLQAMVEDLPQLANRIELDSGRKDPEGYPLPRITHRYHEMDRLALVHSQERMGALLQAAGGKLVDTAEAHTNITGAYTYHLMGTCRMGTDPKDSVVDRDCRFHDVPNLFVADSSFFPTSGGLNPTLTIQANAFRVADYIVKHRKELGG